MTAPVFDLFRQLADTEDDYVAEGDTIVFTRHGETHTLTLSHVPSVGPALRPRGSTTEWVPVETYIQREILNLPVLARQIQRALERKHDQQGLREVIDGPAQLREAAETPAASQASAKVALSSLLRTPSFGSTQIVELMAPAGQGKTVLLEHLAIEAARTYQPNQFPAPLLLVVDLLGRYVGTIHDAIAGSLNNTYTFPRLTGRDVVFCIRQRWLNLALDGFDELVARVGTREAFLRTKELVDELDASGSVVLSARDIFFNLFEIDASIRTYLQPKRGSYSIRELSLDRWGETQGRDVFAYLGSKDPRRDLHDLLTAFSNDRELVFRPFFTIRLAAAWLEGERFGNIGSQQMWDRWNYVIRIFLEREVAEKWRGRNDTPLLTTDQHIAVLGTVAEEMWRSGAFTLTREEVEIAGRIGFSEINVAADRIDDLVSRLPTHGVLSLAGNKSVKFLHESFFLYILGHRLGHALTHEIPESTFAILRAGELSPSVVEWALWCVKKEHASYLKALAWLAKHEDLLTADQVISTNVGAMVGCAGRSEPIEGLIFSKVEFSGRALFGVTVRRVTFKECDVWLADLSSSTFEDCIFERCRFGQLLLDSKTMFPGTSFTDCSLSRLEIKDQEGLFAPSEIAATLRSRKAHIADDPITRAAPARKREVAPKVIHCLDKFRRAKTWDIAVEDMAERHGKTVHDIVKLGLETGVFRTSERDAAGGRKTFFRFTVDREHLFNAQVEADPDQKINAFWDRLEEEFPG